LTTMVRVTTRRTLSSSCSRRRGNCLAMPSRAASTTRLTTSTIFCRQPSESARVSHYTSTIRSAPGLRGKPNFHCRRRCRSWVMRTCRRMMSTNFTAFGPRSPRGVTFRCCASTTSRRPRTGRSGGGCSARTRTTLRVSRRTRCSASPPSCSSPMSMTRASRPSRRLCQG